MKKLLSRTLTGFALALLLVSAAGQTTTTPTTTVQVVTFESNLSSLNANASSVDRSGSGTGVTTMRLERNASGKLVKATLFVRFESRTAQPETFGQFQIMGSSGSPVFTMPLPASQTVPNETFVTTAQSEITDAATVLQLEQLLSNPGRFSLSLGETTTVGSLAGNLSLPESTMLSRTESRLQAVGALDRAIYRLLIRVAAASGVISQPERESMMLELTTLSLQLDQANGIGSGVNTGSANANQSGTSATVSGSTTSPTP